ncbi:MAG: type II toxin-antitoxin system VapB family antitoxin [Leptospirales bacterium]
MALNIKDPEAHNLALLITEETGETITRAVTEALRERLDRIRRQRKQKTTVEDLLAIGARCAQTIKDQPIDHGALLYDDRGLPR